MKMLYQSQYSQPGRRTASRTIIFLLWTFDLSIAGSGYEPDYYEPGQIAGRKRFF